MMKPLCPTALSENIDRVARYDFSKCKVFGSAYTVYQDGVLRFEKCYGTTTPDGDVPVTNQTIFRLASMTKPITAFAALLLVDRHLLSLDDPVDKFLPSFKNISVIDAQGKHFQPVRMSTVRNILSHSSGIASNGEKLAAMSGEDKKTLERSIAYYVESGLDFEPGSQQMYSGTGAFDVLVKIMETVTDIDYPTFLKKEIFEPCDMPNTTFSPTAEQKSRMIAMHQRIDGENATCRMPEGCVFEDFPCTHYLGGAGLVSTLHDYSNFAHMLLNQGKVGGTSLLCPSVFALLGTPQIYKKPTEDWGLGVRVISSTDEPYLPVGTYGWSGAYGSHFWVDPLNKIFAVFMKNSKVDGGASNESSKKFEQAVYSSFEDVR